MNYTREYNTSLTRYGMSVWDWVALSRNPAFNLRDFADYPELPWRWDIVFRNEFQKDKELYVNNGVAVLRLFTCICAQEEMYSEYTDCVDGSAPVPIVSTAESVLMNPYIMSVMCQYV